VEKRLPVLQDSQGHWLYDENNQCPGARIELTDEMQQMKAKWAENPSLR
jgi:hypothetical protein